MTTTTSTNLAKAGRPFRRDGKAHIAFKQSNRVLDDALVVFYAEVHLGSTRTTRVVERPLAHTHIAQVKSQPLSLADFEDKLFGLLMIEKQQEQSGEKKEGIE